MNTIADIKHGNEDTFKRVYDIYHPKLFYFFLKNTRSEDITLELIQETFIKLWRFRSNLDEDMPISRQIFRIARTTLIDILRKKAKERKVFVSVSQEAKEEVENTHTESYSHQYLDKIKCLIAQLPAGQKKIVEYKMEGLSNSEIADQLSISKKTVENQVNKAFQMIRNKAEIPVFLLILLFGVL